MIFFVCAGLYPAFLIEVARSFNLATTAKVLPLTTVPITASVFSCAFIQEFSNSLGYDGVLYLVAALVVLDQIILLVWNISPEAKEKENQIEIEIDIEHSVEISHSINT